MSAGLHPTPSAQPDRTHTTVTSFPEASKISSSFGQNLATPQAMGREPWQEPVTPQTAGNGCRSSGARVLHKHFPWSGRAAQPAQLRAQTPCPACPKLLSSLSVPSPHPLPRQHQPRICSFLTCAFSSYLMKPRSTASTAACRHPQGLSCSWSVLS